jgi:diguanylate cyclase (GGDEF)-like protein
VTIALLLTPMMAVAGLIRWYQGSKGAGTFTIAWTFLMLGLFFQALRDLGLVEHNLINYYWPAVASYTEMVVIFTAIAIGLRELQQHKEEAEHKYLEHLEQAKEELEELVGIRTRELEEEKRAAEHEARTDALTGIHNRRSFLNQAERLFELSKRLRESFSIIMFDLDHFKHVNDTYGHSIGDQALVAFTEAIKTQIRDVDIFGRLGGEEFALAMASSADTTRGTAERLREVVSDVRIDTPQGELTITTSVGIANLDQQASFEELMQLADKALYEAKNSGRNRVIFAQSDGELIQSPAQ